MYCCPECNRFFETDQDPNDKDQVFFCPHCNAAIMFFDAVELKKGSMVAGFKLIERLGEGGMGTVYLAEQVSIKRKVALKILAEELVQKRDSIERFMKEVKTTARLEHPAIVTAIDAGDYRGIYFFAMSYVDGIDLETWIETRGRLPETRALKFIIRIAEALQYAWDKHRLLHRDGRDRLHPQIQGNDLRLHLRLQPRRGQIGQRQDQLHPAQQELPEALRHRDW